MYLGSDFEFYHYCTVSIPKPKLYATVADIELEPPYYYLKEGEVIQSGDEFQDMEGTWSKSVLVGSVVSFKGASEKMYRRSYYLAERQGYRSAIVVSKKEEPKVPLADTPSYRYLKAGETVQGGDECNSVYGVWVKSSLVGLRVNTAEEILQSYRRPIGLGWTGTHSIADMCHPSPNETMVGDKACNTEDVRLAKLCRDKYYLNRGIRAPDDWESTKKFWLDYYAAAKATIDRDSIRDGWSNK